MNEAAAAITRPFRCTHLVEQDSVSYRLNLTLSRSKRDRRVFDVEVCPHCALYLRNSIVEKTRQVFLPQLPVGP